MDIFSHHKGFVYVGFSDGYYEGNYTWMDGITNFTYTNWKKACEYMMSAHVDGKVHLSQKRSSPTAY